MPRRHVCTLTQSITLSPPVLLWLFIKDSGNVQSFLSARKGPVTGSGETEIPATRMKNHCRPTVRGETAETRSRGHMNLIYALGRKLSQLLFFPKTF